jgi:hypothetical protein
MNRDEINLEEVKIAKLKILDKKTGYKTCENRNLFLGKRKGNFSFELNFY